MFKNILDFWKGKEFLARVLEEFKEMLSDAQRMFVLVTGKLLEGEPIPRLKEEIYDLDHKINQRQKDIRKRIVGHLVLQPTVDASTCLVLMSVVKDAERLGDYGKNLLEVTKLLQGPLNKERYTALFNNLDKEIKDLFEKTKRAFIESDETVAARSWESETKIVKRCDAVIEKLAASRVSVNEAVCFTLVARYFKRLSAHLTNIATSVILPVDELDYFDEDRKKAL